MRLFSQFFVVFSLSFAAIFLMPSSAAANLPDRVEAALQKLEAANQSVPRFAFERQTYKKNVKTEVKAFDPTRVVADRWQVIFPSVQENRSQHEKLQKKYASWDGNSDEVLMIPDLRKRMGESAKLVREEKGLEVYEFDVLDEYILEGGGRKSDIHQYLKGEMMIDPKTNDIRRIRYYAPKKFNPLSIVSLSKYEIVQHVGPAWDGGPIVRLYETSKVKGSAIIKKINVDEIMINDNFKPVPAR